MHTNRVQEKASTEKFLCKSYDANYSVGSHVCVYIYIHVINKINGKWVFKNA